MVSHLYLVKFRRNNDFLGVDDHYSEIITGKGLFTKQDALNEAYRNSQKGLGKYFSMNGWIRDPGAKSSAELLKVKAQNDSELIVPIKWIGEPMCQSFDQNGSWIDLQTISDIQLGACEYCEIPFGFAMELPKSCEAYVVPRSSTFRKFGIIQTNGIGIIDSNYNGDNDEWKMPVFCVTNGCFIPKGTRIAQFRIMNEQNRVSIYDCESLGNDNRGGLGSTGD